MLLFVALMQSNVFGQNDVGFKANIATSFIPLREEPRIYPPTNEKTYISPSGQLGIFYNHTFNERSVIGVDLLFNKVATKKTCDKIYQAGSFHEGLLIHFNYLSIPVYYEYQIKDFSLSIGFQTSLCLSGSVKHTSLSNRADARTVGEFMTLYELEKLDYGPKLGLTYKLSTYLDLEGSFYYGLNNTSVETSFFWQDDWRIRQFTLGIKYIFTRPNKSIGS
jgi:hypothetical protein